MLHQWRYERVLVAGAEGLLGQHLTARLSTRCAVLPLGHGGLDITNAEAVERTCTRERPDLIINCAVLGVDACEHDPELGQAVNAVGPHNLARAAHQLDAGFVQFSSQLRLRRRPPRRGAVHGVGSTAPTQPVRTLEA